MKKAIILSAFVIAAFLSCKKKSENNSTSNNNNSTSQPQLKFVYKFDSTQARLDNLGQPSAVPSGHKAQSPRFHGMSAHYIELAQGDYTPVGGGDKIYIAPSVTTGITSGSYTDAIDFDHCTVAGDGQVLASVPLSQVQAGTYKWLRVSLAYQNYDINYTINAGAYPTYTLTTPLNAMGTIASFIGYNTFINSYKVKTQTKNIGTNRLQGYWGFETTVSGFTSVSDGQSPSGATTVVNPIASTSPIPAGSCLVTGQFVNASGAPQMLTITGNETSDIIVTVSLSTNNSFEWREHSGDNNYNPLNGDTVVDMGVRGMIPKINP